MKLLVFAHRLDLGGTQAHAIEMAARLRDRHGYQIVFHAGAGPLQQMMDDHRLPLVVSPDARFQPSLARMRVLRELVAREKPDLIHAWDAWQGIEAFCAVHMTMQVPLIISDMGMTLSHMLPRQVTTTFGVLAVQQQAQQQGWQRSAHLPLPLDLNRNAPDAIDRQQARDVMRVGRDDLLIVAMARLTHSMKAELLLHMIECLRRLGRQLPLRLAIVGDGGARAELQHMATRANRELGRKAISLPGAMTDPRPAYAAADMVIGMGASALRGMAFGKPVIVTGDLAFARLFDPGTAEWFTANGLHGVGDDDDGYAMQRLIVQLATDPQLRDRLGRFGRDHVTRHHDLDRLSDDFAALCRTARDVPPQPTVGGAMRSAVIYLRERRFRASCFRGLGET